MGFDFVAVSKQLVRLSKAAKEAEVALKSFHKPGPGEPDPVAKGRYLNEIHAKLTVFRDILSVIQDLEAWRKTNAVEVRQAIERYKASLAAEIAQNLSQFGYSLLGRVPELRVGLLTIELQLEDGDARIWYGPKTELLDKVPLNAPILCDKIMTHMAMLVAEPLDEPTFLRNLLKAWRFACLRNDHEDADQAQIPIGTVLAELTVVRQPRTFWANPTRTTFVNYGRVQFSYDIYRLGARSVDGMEFRLSVATREQTKNPNTSLWIPRTVHGEGTHFSAISFRPETA